jgi:hypothetical protein
MRGVHIGTIYAASGYIVGNTTGVCTYVTPMRVCNGVRCPGGIEAGCPAVQVPSCPGAKSDTIVAAHNALVRR